MCVLCFCGRSVLYCGRQPKQVIKSDLEEISPDCLSIIHPSKKDVCVHRGWWTRVAGPGLCSCPAQRVVLDPVAAAAGGVCAAVLRRVCCLVPLGLCLLQRAQEFILLIRVLVPRPVTSPADPWSVQDVLGLRGGQGGTGCVSWGSSGDFLLFFVVLQPAGGATALEPGELSHTFSCFWDHGGEVGSQHSQTGVM